MARLGHRPALHRTRRALGGPALLRFPFASLEDFPENGSALVGTAEQITAKLLRLHARFGNQVFGVGVEGFFSTYTTELAVTRGYLERFFDEVAPILRAEVPTTVWE